MAEARRQEREIINYYLPTFDRRSGSLLGYLVDITEQGLMLQTHDQLAPDQDIELRLQLKEPLDGADHILLEARVVWSRKQGTAIFFHTGFEFRSIEEDQRRLVNMLIKSYRLDMPEAD